MLLQNVLCKRREGVMMIPLEWRIREFENGAERRWQLS